MYVVEGLQCCRAPDGTAGRPSDAAGLVGDDLRISIRRRRISPSVNDFRTPFTERKEQKSPSGGQNEGGSLLMSYLYCSLQLRECLHVGKWERMISFETYTYASKHAMQMKPCVYVQL